MSIAGPDGAQSLMGTALESGPIAVNCRQAFHSTLFFSLLG
jgi:hypothetical protein